ncbi:MAG: hypothetical protein ACHP9Z_05705 [Streptosporangiales bacterium]
MAQAAPERTKIPTNPPQPARSGAARPAGRPKKVGGTARGRVLASGTGRAATRGGGEVIELGCGITVYPAREEQGRWRAVWYENGERRQCEAVTEEKLAGKLEKVTERLEADAPSMKRPGADLIAYSGTSPPPRPRRRARPTLTIRHHQRMTTRLHRHVATDIPASSTQTRRLHSRRAEPDLNGYREACSTAGRKITRLRGAGRVMVVDTEPCNDSFGCSDIHFSAFNLAFTMKS